MASIIVIFLFDSVTIISMAFSVVITNSSCMNKHTSIFHFSDTLTYLITRSITQFVMAVRKNNISHLEGGLANLKSWGILDHYTYLVCFCPYYNNQKEACTICRDWKKDCRQFCCPRPEQRPSEHYEIILLRNT